RGGEVTATSAGLGEGCDPDVTIATVTTGGAFALALDLAGRGGRIGIFGASSLPFATPTRPITAKELDIFGSRGNPGVWPDLIALMAEGRVKPERLISRTMPLDDLPHAFALKASRAVSLSKIVLQP
ncbi:MAG: hypothetical protein M0Z94_07200, partial [Dehalococcoidales bacterium]|nr:hypothetical protein [Dehalococcoidales bacterium]